MSKAAKYTKRTWRWKCLVVNETKRVVTLDLWINARLVYCLSRKKVWWFWSGTDGQIFPRCLTQAWIIICNLNLAATKLGNSGYLGLVIVCVGTFYLAQTCEQNCSLVSIRVKYHNLWLMSFYDFPVFLFSKSDCVFSVRARETQPTERYSAASHTASLNSRVPSAPYMFYSHTYWRQRGFWLKWQLFGPVPLFFLPSLFSDGWIYGMRKRWRGKVCWMLLAQMRSVRSNGLSL